MNNIQKETERFARTAGEYARKKMNDVIVGSKDNDPRNLVTNIDIEISNILKEEIAKQFPDDIYYSEEETRAIDPAKRVWVVDPIDGTSNYARSIPLFSSCVTVMEGDEVIAVAVYAPMLEEMFSYGEGVVTLNDTPISVGKVEELWGAYVNFHPGRKEHLREWAGETQVQLLGKAKKSLNTGSSALDICYVACGRFDVLIYGTLSTLDIAGTIQMLRAAGGEMYDYDTKKPVGFSPEPQRIIATATPKLLEDYFNQVISSV